MNFGRFLHSTFILASAISALGSNANAVESIDLDKIQISPDLQRLVPKRYQNDKSLTTGVNPDVAPVKFIDDDGNLTGLVPELVEAGAKKLGLTIDFQQTSFDALIPGMKANRFDFILSLADFPARQKLMTFVDYLNIGQSLVAKPDAPFTISNFSDLCGLSVAIPRGDTTIETVEKLSITCLSEGKKPIVSNTFGDVNTTLLAISNKSSDIAWIDSPVASYNASKFPDRYKVVFYDYIAPYGVGFASDEDGKKLAYAFQAAFLDLQKDGTYESLVSKWGLPKQDSLPSFPINGGR